MLGSHPLFRDRASLSGIILPLLLAASAWSDEKKSTAPQLSDFTFSLLNDASARDVLALTLDQRAELDRVLHKHNRVLLAIRDVGPSGAPAAAQPFLAEARADVSKLLTEPQRLHLQSLVLQAQGYDHLARDDVAQSLKLTDSQQRKLANISADFHAKSESLRAAGQSRSPQELQQELTRLQAHRQKQIVATLEPGQLKLWAKLLGEPFDFSKIATGPAFAPEFDAPEFADAESWLNSPPLTMELLRGRVVVIHFFAFGCFNCHNNYPWYREWQQELTGQGVALIGIHTPETSAEENVAALADSLKENGLHFPVAVDKQKSMWNEWNNNIWPAVYIIDKRGRLRFWWYGELDWQGAGNQKVARRQIEQLLKEPAL